MYARAARGRGAAVRGAQGARRHPRRPRGARGRGALAGVDVELQIVVAFGDSGEFEAEDFQSSDVVWRAAGRCVVRSGEDTANAEKTVADAVRAAERSAPGGGGDDADDSCFGLAPDWASVALVCERAGGSLLGFDARGDLAAFSGGARANGGVSVRASRDREPVGAQLLWRRSPLSAPPEAPSPIHRPLFLEESPGERTLALEAPARSPRGALAGGDASSDVYREQLAAYPLPNVELRDLASLRATGALDLRVALDDCCGACALDGTEDDGLAWCAVEDGVAMVAALSSTERGEELTFAEVDARAVADHFAAAAATGSSDLSPAFARIAQAAADAHAGEFSSRARSAEERRTWRRRARSGTRWTAGPGAGRRARGRGRGLLGPRFLRLALTGGGGDCAFVGPRRGEDPLSEGEDGRTTPQVGDEPYTPPPSVGRLSRASSFETVEGALKSAAKAPATIPASGGRLSRTNSGERLPDDDEACGGFFARRNGDEISVGLRGRAARASFVGADDAKPAPSRGATNEAFARVERSLKRIAFRRGRRLRGVDARRGGAEGYQRPCRRAGPGAPEHRPAATHCAVAAGLATTISVAAQGKTADDEAKDREAVARALRCALSRASRVASQLRLAPVRPFRARSWFASAADALAHLERAFAEGQCAKAANAVTNRTRVYASPKAPATPPDGAAVVGGSECYARLWANPAGVVELRLFGARPFSDAAVAALKLKCAFVSDVDDCARRAFTADFFAGDPEARAPLDVDGDDLALLLAERPTRAAVAVDVRAALDAEARRLFAAVVAACCRRAASGAFDDVHFSSRPGRCDAGAWADALGAPPGGVQVVLATTYRSGDPGFRVGLADLRLAGGEVACACVLVGVDDDGAVERLKTWLARPRRGGRVDRAAEAAEAARGGRRRVAVGHLARLRRHGRRRLPARDAAGGPAELRAYGAPRRRGVAPRSAAAPRRRAAAALELAVARAGSSAPDGAEPPPEPLPSTGKKKRSRKKNRRPASAEPLDPRDFFRARACPGGAAATATTRGVGRDDRRRVERRRRLPRRRGLWAARATRRSNSDGVPRQRRRGAPGRGAAPGRRRGQGTRRSSDARFDCGPARRDSSDSSEEGAARTARARPSSSDDDGPGDVAVGEAYACALAFRFAALAEWTAPGGAVVLERVNSGAAGDVIATTAGRHFDAGPVLERYDGDDDLSDGERGRPASLPRRSRSRPSGAAPLRLVARDGDLLTVRRLTGAPSTTSRGGGGALRKPRGRRRGPRAAPREVARGDGGWCGAASRWRRVVAAALEDSSDSDEFESSDDDDLAPSSGSSESEESDREDAYPGVAGCVEFNHWFGWS
ncbi:hypothetical protein JL720_14204 [Aureococcus anophagefferens]|nr:hypothetical protein JL720_14204 [Aureococcus anophagefferens]